MNTSKIELTNNRYRLGNHISSASGWINDPNGFCYFKGYYHIFFQHHPHSVEWGPMHWGHARSKDLIHWEELPIALTPGDVEDKNGCFSGSAIEKDGILYLFYTGHHYYGDDDPDNFWQNQNMAYSEDGIHFTKYEHNPIIAKEPVDNTHHFRDPKVWEHKGIYYMILGSQNEEGMGRGIVYQSKDLFDWEYMGEMSKGKVLEKDGFMWECPDFFELEGKDILLLSPQGIASEDKQHLNLFQTGYYMGEYDYQTNEFKHGDFQELDKGHDFYATQTTLAPDGRRLVFAWMAMWESDMPEQEDGWAGALTLPRELVLKNDQLVMKPVKELELLRLDEGKKDSNSLVGKNMIAKDICHTEIELTVSTENQDEVIFSLEEETGEIVLSLTYFKECNELVLNRNTPDGLRYGKIKEQDELKLHAYFDKSSMEIFVNDGEVVFTERFYSEKTLNSFLTTKEKTNVEQVVYSLKDNAVSYGVSNKLN